MQILASGREPTRAIQRPRTSKEVAQIIAEKAQAYGLTYEIVTGRSRLKEHRLVRSLIIQEVRELADAQRTAGALSHARLGALFGGRDHSTISDVLEIPRAKLLEGLEQVALEREAQALKRARLAAQANKNTGK